MDKFLGKWPRVPIPFDGEDFSADELVGHAIDELLYLSGPTAPIAQAWNEEFLRGLLDVINHIQKHYWTAKEVTLPEFAATMSWKDMVLHNLWHMAYCKAKTQATDLLQDWCAQANVAMPVSDAEHAIILVRALRTQHMLSSTIGEPRVLLAAALQECIALLEGFVGNEPTGNAAEQARRAFLTTNWDAPPWFAFVTWLARRLPVS